MDTSQRSLLSKGLQGLCGLIILLSAWQGDTAVRAESQPASQPRYIVLLVADGWGPKHIAAANNYTNDTPAYQHWPRHWLTTYPAAGSYDPARAWTEFEYVMDGYTDSAAAATALYTGVKTANGGISVSADAEQRLMTLSETVRSLGMATGAVSSVYISNATLGAWGAHNDARGNGYAISDELLWGNSNTTGLPTDNPRYDGGHGPTFPPVDVLIGTGHPAWQGGIYVNQAIYDKLAAESGKPDAFILVERIAGSTDGGERLLEVARRAEATRLVGLFGGAGGILEYRLADGSGHDPENPTLAEMTDAALTVLQRDPEGFALVIEGGAIDYGSHSNNMDLIVGEMIGFNQAVKSVIDWVEDGGNGSHWGNTLVVVTGDHETGYLSAGPGLFPDQHLGAVNTDTLALEKVVGSTGRRASWEDTNINHEIDVDEKVFWAWNSATHTNTLIPLYARGAEADRFTQAVAGIDPMRGPFIDNTRVHEVMVAMLTQPSMLWLPLIESSVAPRAAMQAKDRSLSTSSLGPTIHPYPPTASTPTSAKTSTTPNVLPTPTFADEVVALVNDERWDNGQLPPLKAQSTLGGVSKAHSADMAQDNYVMHCDPDTGSLPWDRMSAAGYNWNYAGENIAAGYTSPAAVMEGWMSSSGHRENILSTNFRDVGIGYFDQDNDQANVRLSSTHDCNVTSSNNGPYYHYWTQDFGAEWGGYPLIIDREAFYAASIEVDLYIHQPDGATQMRFRNEEADWSVWESFASDKVWRLSSGSGEKRISVEITAGSTTYQAFDTIILDAPGPQPPPVTLNEMTYLTVMWLHHTDNLWYDVFRSGSDPYLVPATSEHIGVEIPPPTNGDTVRFDDTSALDNTTYFYLVQSVGKDGNQAEGNRSGRFVFSLKPGT